MPLSGDTKHAVIPLGQVAIFTERLDDFFSLYGKCEEGFTLSCLPLHRPAY